MTTNGLCVLLCHRLCANSSCKQEAIGNACYAPTSNKDQATPLPVDQLVNNTITCYYCTTVLYCKNRIFRVHFVLRHWPIRKNNWRKYVTFSVLLSSASTDI